MPANPTYGELAQRVKALEKNAVELRRTRERIRHLNAVLSSIRNVSRMIAKEKNRDRLIREICRSLIENRGYYNAWMAVTDQSGILSVAEAGLGRDGIPLIEKLKSSGLENCCGNVLSCPGILTIQNPASFCTDCPVSHIYEGRGAMAARLEHSGKIYGILTVSVPEAFSTDPDEKALFQDVAADIAFALHNIEVEEERRQTEEKLREARDKLERRVRERTVELELLSSKLLNAQEEERKRIAGDLHDGIGQSLSAIKFMVETVLERNSTDAAADLGSLKTLVPMLQKASEEVRTIVMNLRPSVLDDLGILATVGWFCRQFRTVYSFIRVEEDIDIREKDVPDPLKTIIFRVLQEAMNNVAKHSHADCVWLSFKKNHNAAVELLIEDNGDGFDVPAFLSVRSSEKGFGITGMKERTELSGGIFEICSAASAGTVVRALWPHQHIRSD
jgi:signal transduction histidine kinase